MKRKTLAGILIIELVLLVVLIIAYNNSVKYPGSVQDSDGTPSGMIIENLKNGDSEAINLKASPYGYILANKWGGNILDSILSGEMKISIEWRAERDEGAGNIYIGYSTDGENFEEIGPLEPTPTKQETSITGLYLNDVDNLEVRFRGEDIDKKVAANAYINKITLESSSSYMIMILMYIMIVLTLMTMFYGYKKIKI